MSRLLALYPDAWRRRYEPEFRSLMAERPPSSRDRLDIIRGALDARLHPQLGPAPSGDTGTRMPRRAGAVAVLGGAAWTTAGLVFFGAPVMPGLGYKETSFAIGVAFAGALATGLAASLFAHSLPVRRVGTWRSAVAIVLGAFALLWPWPILAFGYYGVLLGTIAFGLFVTARVGRSGTLVAVAGLLASGFNTEDERAFLLLPLGGAWILFGVLLVVRGIHTADVKPNLAP